MRRNTATNDKSNNSMTTTSSTTEFDDQTNTTNSMKSYKASAFPTMETIDIQQMKQKLLNMKEEMKNLTNLTNYYRRLYYAESELMIMDIEYVLKSKQQYNFNDIELQLQEILEECTLISKQLKLQYSNKLTSTKGQHLLYYILYKIDELIRSIAVFLFFLFSGFCLTLPCILLCIRSIDTYLVSKGYLSPFYQISNLMKSFIAHVILRIAGIELITENLQYEYFGKECSIICFSHSSTIDAFVISLAIPVRHYTLAKAELFLIPFFGWQLLAYGAIPIDRSNREQAIRAIAFAAESAGVGDTVCASPEGTRSTTGQIIAFKKGPFHLWESLKTPMIPLVIYGAFDLLPPGNLMSIPGKVHARFLPPTYPTQANTRDEMAYLIRKQMLQAWKDGPKDAGAPLTWSSRLITQLYVFAVYYGSYLTYQYFPMQTVQITYHISKTQFFGIVTGFCIGITLIFYIYLLYLKPLFKYLLGKVVGRGGGGGNGGSYGNNRSQSPNNNNAVVKEVDEKDSKDSGLNKRS